MNGPVNRGYWAVKTHGQPIHRSPRRAGFAGCAIEHHQRCSKLLRLLAQPTIRVAGTTTKLPHSSLLLFWQLSDVMIFNSVSLKHVCMNNYLLHTCTTKRLAAHISKAEGQKPLVCCGVCGRAYHKILFVDALSRTHRTKRVPHARRRCNGLKQRNTQTSRAHNQFPGSDKSAPPPSLSVPREDIATRHNTASTLPFVWIQQYSRLFRLVHQGVAG